MRILLTGATGYIAGNLLPALIEKGCEVICCVRDISRFERVKQKYPGVVVVEADFLKPDTLKNIPDNIDAAYYLIHSMSSLKGDFTKMEEQSAINFRERFQNTGLRQVVYLSGIVNAGNLSRHLSSRLNVERILAEGTYALTTLRAGIIIGAGSASFQIIRDLVEKLPVMIAPRWLNTPSQPIAIKDVVRFLSGVLFNEKTFNNSYDIGGPDILTYQQMLQICAKVMGLRRWIRTVPVMTPKLSSYWLYFITSASYPLARNLVDSMKVEIICRENDLAGMLNINPVSFEQAVREAITGG